VINIVWLLLVGSGILIAAVNGTLDSVSSEIVQSCKSAVEFVIGLTGLLMLWSGLMQVASASGLTESIAKAISPIVRFLFPSIPRRHPALSYISLAMSSNILGLGNASTPLGIKAIEELQKLNPRKDTASDAMCTLLAITTSSITVVPTTVIAMRGLTGSANPADILITTLIATTCSTAAALIADSLFRRASAKSRSNRGR
jgi:spore maturation protein A